MSQDPSTWTHDGQTTIDCLIALANLAFESLQHTRLGQPLDCVFSHSEPPDDSCNFLAIWVDRWTAYVDGQFPLPMQDDPKCHGVIYSPEVVLTLRRPCAPTLNGDRSNPFPEPTANTAAAADLLVDIRAIQCALLNGAGSILAEHHGPRAKIMWGEATPTDNGDMFGWDMRFTLEFANGCCGL